MKYSALETNFTNEACFLTGTSKSQEKKLKKIKLKKQKTPGPDRAGDAEGVEENEGAEAAGSEK